MEARRFCLQSGLGPLLFGTRLFDVRSDRERVRFWVEREPESEFGGLAVAVQIAAGDNDGAIAVFRRHDLVLIILRTGEGEIEQLPARLRPALWDRRAPRLARPRPRSRPPRGRAARRFRKPRLQ